MKDIESIKSNSEKEDLEKYDCFQKIKEKLDTNGENEFPFDDGKVLIAGEDFIYKKGEGSKIYFFKNSRILFLPIKN